ncbi:hypothetical protein ACFYM2_03430 [Streptomyces sp. NPDC006711]|uniref:hypothetical protein n=1 Tax=Streptomyces sp. NPDC006711 TaxID=3364762 RepID=UPI0036C43674
MTVPTVPEQPHVEQVGAAGVKPAVPTSAERRRKLCFLGLAAVALAVVILVLTYPNLAAPVGTSAGVVAAVAPLVQRRPRAGTASEAIEDEA